jgi:peptidoglycan/xylan/chitin deacetylase (PgdA/CDA1 family)
LTPSKGITRLQAYSQAGHIIANHTHSHPDFNKMTVEEYAQNFLLADSELKRFKGFKKLFRFPYLRDGDSEQKCAGMQAVLKKQGYINAYITLNNYVRLHEMDISALFVGDLVDELRRKGWRIITPEEAYTDEIAQYQPQGVFSYNPGRIGEIARDKGQKMGLWHTTLEEEYLEKRFAE